MAALPGGSKTPVCKLYRALGWSVFPVGADKRPLVPWKEFTTRHPSADEMRGWVDRFSETGIAVITGKVSGLIVLDPDTPEAVEECEALGVVKTPTVVTPRGGKHYYFSLPPGATFKNAAGLGESKHIDVRCEGGYVVAPNTKRADGKRYEWEVRPNQTLVKRAPDWLLEMLKVKDERQVCKEVIRAQENTSADLDERHRQHTGVLERLPKFVQDLIQAPPVKGTRSDNDFAVVLVMLANGCSESDIRSIFVHYPIGQKYRQEGEKYLGRTIDEAIDKLRLVTVKYADLQTYGQASAYSKEPGARLHLALEVEDEVERGRIIRCGLTVPQGNRNPRWDRFFEAADVPVPSTLDETASVRKELIGKKLRVQLVGAKRNTSPVAYFFHV